MRPAFLLLATGWPGPALAAPALATGSAPDIPWLRLGIAILLGLLLAGAAAWLLRRHAARGGRKRSISHILSHLSPGAKGALHRRIRIVETRRASQHGDLCLVEADGRTYLLALTAGGATLIDRHGPSTAPVGAAS